MATPPSLPAPAEGKYPLERPEKKRRLDDLKSDGMGSLSCVYRFLSDSTPLPPAICALEGLVSNVQDSKAVKKTAKHLTQNLKFFKGIADFRQAYTSFSLLTKLESDIEKQKSRSEEQGKLLQLVTKLLPRARIPVECQAHVLSFLPSFTVSESTVALDTIYAYTKMHPCFFNALAQRIGWIGQHPLIADKQHIDPLALPADDWGAIKDKCKHFSLYVQSETDTYASFERLMQCGNLESLTVKGHEIIGHPFLDIPENLYSQLPKLKKLTLFKVIVTIPRDLGNVERIELNDCYLTKELPKDARTPKGTPVEFKLSSTKVLEQDNRFLEDDEDEGF